MVLLYIFSFIDPCPLIALANVLSIRGRRNGIELPAVSETVSAEWILGALDEYLARRKIKLNDKMEESGDWTNIEELEAIELAQGNVYNLVSLLGNLNPVVRNVTKFASEVLFIQ
jgi:hypothetical protein